MTPSTSLLLQIGLSASDRTSCLGRQMPPHRKEVLKKELTWRGTTFDLTLLPPTFKLHDHLCSALGLRGLATILSTSAWPVE